MTIGLSRFNFYRFKSKKGINFYINNVRDPSQLVPKQCDKKEMTNA